MSSKRWKDCSYAEREAWVAAARRGKPRPGSVAARAAELRRQFEERRPAKKVRKMPAEVTASEVRYATAYLGRRW